MSIKPVSLLPVQAIMEECLRVYSVDRSWGGNIVEEVSVRAFIRDMALTLCRDVMGQFQYETWKKNCGLATFFTSENTIEFVTDPLANLFLSYLENVHRVKIITIKEQCAEYERTMKRLNMRVNAIF